MPSARCKVLLINLNNCKILGHMNIKICELINSWINFYMSNIVNVLVDKTILSKNALLGLSLPQGYLPNIVELSYENLEGDVHILAELKGQVINLISPETFSLYRGKLYQLLATNKNISPFEPLANSVGSVARWTFLGENITLSNSSKVGLSSYIGPNVVIGANSNIGNFCWIGEGVVIAPGVTLGNNVTVHDGVHIGTGAKITKFNEIRRNIAPNEILIDKRIETDFFNSTAYLFGA